MSEKILPVKVLQPEAGISIFMPNQCRMRAELQAALTELAEMAKGATEREIETEVVHLLKQAGWPRSQISQDFTISDKGADKADIVLKMDNQPVILVEVKNMDIRVMRTLKLIATAASCAQN